jgi:hypothetical protein
MFFGKKGNLMENLGVEMGPIATTLIALVAGLVQQIKRVPAIASLQEKFPVYQVSALGLGIAAAHLFALSNPIVAGVFIGLSACGAYDIVTGVPTVGDKQK